MPRVVLLQHVLHRLQSRHTQPPAASSPAAIVCTAPPAGVCTGADAQASEACAPDAQAQARGASPIALPRTAAIMDTRMAAASPDTCTAAAIPAGAESAAVVRGFAVSPHLGSTCEGATSRASKRMMRERHGRQVERALLNALVRYHDFPDARASEWFRCARLLASVRACWFPCLLASSMRASLLDCSIAPAHPFEAIVGKV